MVILFVFFFFFKQKTAYEITTGDWSSDVCSSDLVVHGGGKAITRAMEKAGLKANFIQGQRVTDEPTVKIVDDVLSREINPEVVATINSLGGAAKGFAGPDIFKCRKIFVKGPAGEQLD